MRKTRRVPSVDGFVPAISTPDARNSMSNEEARGKGYDWNQGMSVNAVEAYDEGRFPISRLRRQQLDDAGIPKSIPVGFARYLADTGHWKPCELHHTGGTWFNKTDFYSTDGLADTLDQLRDEGKLEEVLTEYRAANRSKRATAPQHRGHAGKWALCLLHRKQEEPPQTRALGGVHGHAPRRVGPPRHRREKVSRQPLDRIHGAHRRRRAGLTGYAATLPPVV